ncbi:MAG: Tetratricopeptide domain protein [Promethearchaeota archaeon]|nr:MAG: Tetratricopeptide domain protein [Candidatus Lokiarchaeota archaeon]
MRLKLVAIMNDLFQRSRQFFESGDIPKTLETYEKAISSINHSEDSGKYINFLSKLLKHCREHNLQEEEAIVLRDMGRTYSVFKQYVESLKHHWLSLKIQRKLGKKIEIAQGLMFIAEDLEVRGDYDESIESYEEAMQIFKTLGKEDEVSMISKKLKKLEDFSKEALEEEFIRSKFNIDDY